MPEGQTGRKRAVPLPRTLGIVSRCGSTAQNISVIGSLAIPMGSFTARVYNERVTTQVDSVDTVVSYDAPSREWHHTSRRRRIRAATTVG